MKPKISISSIAKLANTSRGTVDRVINGRGKVNKELEKRIKEIIAEYGYEVNSSARALSLSKNNYILGVVINSVGNPFFDKVNEGIRDGWRAWENYGLDIYRREIRGYNEQEQIDAIDDVIARGANILALTPINTEVVIEKLNSLTIPVVAFNNDLHLEKKLAYVGCDYKEGGNIGGDIANLMLSEGDTAAVVTGSLRTLGHRQRSESFAEVVSRAGRKVIATIENNDDNALSYELTAKLIAEHSPELIYFAAGGIAGGLQAVADSGKKIKIITVDELPEIIDGLRSGFISATISQQPYEQGKMMVNIAAQYLYYKKRPEHIHNYLSNIIVLPSMIKK